MIEESGATARPRSVLARVPHIPYRGANMDQGPTRAALYIDFDNFFGG